MLAKGKAPKVSIVAERWEPVTYIPEGSKAERLSSPLKSESKNKGTYVPTYLVKVVPI
jgi:hypothetical protein